MVRRLLAATFLGIVFVLLQCAEPTAIVVEVHSEIPCSAGAQVALFGARSATELVGRAPSAFATRCDPEAGGSVSRGKVVLTPVTSRDEPLVFSVVTRDDAVPVETGCAASSTSLDHCIVARRQLAFLPGNTLTMRVDLRRSCLGVPCTAAETCIQGKCTSALVDVAQCVVACDERSVTGPAADSGAPDVAVVDAGSDASTPVVNQCPTKGFLGEFAIWMGKVNVHRTVVQNSSAGPWSVDDDCTSGANLNTIAYCKKFWPAATSIVPYAAVTPELKPFTQGGGTAPTCGKVWMDPGLGQYGCCGP